MSWIQTCLGVLLINVLPCPGYAQWVRLSLAESPFINAISCVDSLVIVATKQGGFISPLDGDNLRTSGAPIASQYIVDVEYVSGGGGGAKILASALNDQVYASDDSGRNWISSDALRAFELSRVNTSEGAQKLFTWTSSGLLASKDSGITWHPSGLGIVAPAAALTFASANGLFFGAGINNDLGAIFKSTDEGSSWQEIYSAESPCDKIVSLKKVASTDIVFVATRRHGLLRSTNLGETWESVKNGLPDSEIRDLIGKADILLLSLKDSGLFFSRDYGETWIFAGEGITDTKGYALGMSGRYAYFGGTYSGLWRRPLVDFYTQAVLEQSNAVLNIYPNPARSILNVPGGLMSAEDKIQVFSASGQLISLGRMSQSQGASSLDVSGLKCGHYYLLLNSNHETRLLGRFAKY